VPSKDELRATLRANLAATMSRVNDALRGKSLRPLEPVLRRLGRNAQLPHWYERLRTEQALPNLDSKTIGSVIEMLFVAVLETSTFKNLGIPPLRINPARGVDLPDLDIGIKSPSKNFCTSEPFFSAYERLLGSEHDALVLLTDYQEAKKKPPLRLQIIDWSYLGKAQIADRNLCRTAKKVRDLFPDERDSWTKRVFRFLAFVNQSDWRASRILSLIDAMDDEQRMAAVIEESPADFARRNKLRGDKGAPLLAETDLTAIMGIHEVEPLRVGIIDAADNWVVEVQKDMARLPNENEWQRLLVSRFEGAIGMSLALQWRYNFGSLFGRGIVVPADPLEAEES
jgi:hypothetical protein